LARAGLKTIVVMAGVCALQANPRVVQPQPGGWSTNTVEWREGPHFAGVHSPSFQRSVFT